MPINLGFDFGTTYSIASIIKSDASGFQKPEVCTIYERAAIDSIALKIDNEFQYGWDARTHLGESKTTVFRGFKMLIGEENAELLKKRKYSKTDTPEKITAKFIEYVINTVNSNYNPDREINKLVVGVPAIWMKSDKTVDRSALLREIILKKTNIKVSNVEIVSEPALACAFCSDKYKKESGKDFNGLMILVDYGGGSLDISLCDVKQNDITSSVTEIETMGNGWNTEESIGFAGLKFMEEVTKLVFGNEITGNAKFPMLVAQVEQIIKDKSSDIERIFDEKSMGDLTQVEDSIGYVYFNDERYYIKCGVLASAYNNVIKPVLEEQLIKIKEACEKRNINIYDIAQDKQMKIITVGGFGRFYLTRNQISDFFQEVVGIDERFSIQLTANEQEYAVAHGAALVANEIIGFNRLMPYHLGIGTGGNGAPMQTYYAMKKGEYLEFNKKYFIEYSDNDPMFFLGDRIPFIVRNWNDDSNEDNGRITYKLNEKSANKLLINKSSSTADNNENNHGYPFKIAFSLSESMVLTIYIHFVSGIDKPNDIRAEKDIMLSTVDDLFEPLQVVGDRQEG